MKLISWNVNGIRATIGKGFGDFVSAENPDILCLQETKARPEQVTLPFEMASYHAAWNSAQKPGYSGVAIFSKEKPSLVTYGFGIEEHDNEGRVITAEFEKFILVNVYTPNAQDELRRLPYRMQWDHAFKNHLLTLHERGKPVIFCGDLNVAHCEIDLARPKDNHFSPGFSAQERQGFSDLLAAGFVDTFRHFQPEATNEYSWWSYRAGARARNVGWRIDYFGISTNGIPLMESAGILQQVLGSDHCPVTLTLK